MGKRQVGLIFLMPTVVETVDVVMRSWDYNEMIVLKSVFRFVLGYGAEEFEL